MFDSEKDIATEFPEDVWHTSEWIPQMLVGRRLRRIVKDGRKLPSHEVVTSVVMEMAKAIKDNNGTSFQKQIDFEQILNRLDCGEQR